MSDHKIQPSELLKDKKTVAAVVLAIVLVLVLVFLLSQCNRGSNDPARDTDSQSQDTVLETEDVGLKQDAYPAVCSLIHSYFDALETYHIERYQEIVVGDSMTEEKLRKKGEFIESYENITCYTKKGFTEGTYVAYVYYEIKFHNIDTLSPALIRLYICSGSNGGLYIDAGPQDAEVSAYINNLTAEDDVLKLNADTQEAFVKAMEADEKLASLIQFMRDGSQYEEPGSEIPETEAEIPVDQMVFEDRNEDVMTTTALRVRNTPTTSVDDNIIGRLEAGDTVKRTGECGQWSRIEYKGQVAYVSSDYLILK